MTETNAYGQPVGALVPDWTVPALPAHAPLEGRVTRLEPLDPARHGDDLWAEVQAEPDGRSWTYLPHGPFDDRAPFDAMLEANAKSRDPLFFAIVATETGRAMGFCSLLRITPAAGSIEVGFIWFGPGMKRSPLATEAMHLLMREVFSLGYRRYEWKCDALNAPSRAAAKRFGFSYEGIFRQAVVVKGRNRDTAWFACVDHEWPALKAAYETWLAADNFDASGAQKTRLSDLTAPILVARD